MMFTTVIQIQGKFTIILVHSPGSVPKCLSKPPAFKKKYIYIFAEDTFRVSTCPAKLSSFAILCFQNCRFYQHFDFLGHCLLAKKYFDNESCVTKIR